MLCLWLRWFLVRQFLVCQRHEIHAIAVILIFSLLLWESCDGCWLLVQFEIWCREKCIQNFAQHKYTVGHIPSNIFENSFKINQFLCTHFLTVVSIPTSTYTHMQLSHIQIWTGSALWLCIWHSNIIITSMLSCELVIVLLVALLSLCH